MSRLAIGMRKSAFSSTPCGWDGRWGSFEYDGKPRFVPPEGGGSAKSRGGPAGGGRGERWYEQNGKPRGLAADRRAARAGGNPGKKQAEVRALCGKPQVRRPQVRRPQVCGAAAGGRPCVGNAAPGPAIRAAPTPRSRRPFTAAAGAASRCMRSCITTWTGRWSAPRASRRASGCCKGCGRPQVCCARGARARRCGAAGVVWCSRQREDCQMRRVGITGWAFAAGTEGRMPLA